MAKKNRSRDSGILAGLCFLGVVGTMLPSAAGRAPLSALSVGHAASGKRPSGDLDVNPPRCTWVVGDGSPLVVSGAATDDLKFDSGIGVVELAEGAVNVTLQVEDFEPGTSQVGFTVTRIESSASGQGVVVVRDQDENECTLAADFSDVPAGPLVDVEICEGEGNRLEIDNALATPAGPSSCGVNLYTVEEPPLPPGYEPAPGSAVLTINSPVSGETDMVLTSDVPFDPRLRLLLSRLDVTESAWSAAATLTTFGGTPFGPFKDVTTHLSVDPPNSILIGGGRWSTVKVAFALQSEICNGLDDDLDGLVDEGLPVGDPSTDADADGFPLCPAPGSEPDCNDQRAFIHPGALELCNGFDDDCDSAIDDDCVDFQQSYISVSRNQFLAGTLQHQDVYILPGAGTPIEPFVGSFLSSSVGLDALDVLPGGDLLFSVERSGSVHHAGGVLFLRHDRVYRFDRTSGAITTVVDWSALGLDIGSLDALDHLQDGSFAFSTATLRGVTHAGGFIVLRPENVYRFDPQAETLELLFDGRSLGLADLDGVDVLGLRVAFSTATLRGVAHAGGFIVLRPENVYLFDATNGSLTLVLDGEDAGLQTLDAFTLGVELAP